MKNNKVALAVAIISLATAIINLVYVIKENKRVDKYLGTLTHMYTNLEDKIFEED